MSLSERFKTHPVMAAVVGVVTTAVAVASSFALLQAIWALFSSEPFFPAVGDWISQWSEPLTAFLLVVGLVALIGWMVYIQFMILRAVRPNSDEKLPENLTWAEGWLSAGSDMTIDVPVDQAKTAKSVTFTARQGKKRIVQNKPGEVDNSRGLIRLPFSRDETGKLMDGYLLMDATIVTGEGNQLVTNRMAIKTYGRL